MFDTKSGFVLIKGTFHVTGYSPDGDSVRFKPVNIATLDKVTDGKPNPRDLAKGLIQLRIEGIDTLETHFKVQGGNIKQPPEFADQATAALMEKLGIKDIVWSPTRSKVISAKDGSPGYILTRKFERNGRPVSFVFAGNPQENDGENVYLDPTRAKKSINYTMLADGLAYPTFYEGFFFDIRQEFIKATKKARSENKGLFLKDLTQIGFTINNLAELERDGIILPKLFRRLGDFFAENPGSNLSGYLEWTKTAGKDKILYMPTLQFTNFWNVMEFDSGKLRMVCLPEELVFMD